MTAVLFPLVGGIGFFLLGMALLSDGLKTFAGDSLRRVLVQFTGRPVKAFASGALATALVQSSSATTVMVISFVSAGLLTFSQAIGVVMGASLGTTSTGWIVSVIGLKISVGFYALFLVGLGAFVKLLARGRWKSAGLALAGFGLIFVGIDTLQTGMQGFSGAFKLPALPSAGFWSHLMMMLVGIAMTIVMQSSSAAMATILTALHTDSINFEQAASLVIGAAVGAAAFLPRVDRFAQWIERRLPERGPALTRHLDPTLFHLPAVALEAARRALSETACAMFAILRDHLAGQGDVWNEPRRAQVGRALDDLQAFFARIPPTAEDQSLSAAHLAQMHAIDHLVRLYPRLRPPADLRQPIQDERLAAEVRRTGDIVDLALAGLQDRAPFDWLKDVEKRSVELAERRRQDRPEVLLGTTQGSWAPATALQRSRRPAPARTRKPSHLAHLPPSRRRQPCAAGRREAGRRSGGSCFSGK